MSVKSSTPYPTYRGGPVPDVFPGPIGIVEECVGFEILNPPCPQPFVSCCQGSPDKVNTSAAHLDVRWEFQGAFVVHDVPVGADQGLRVERTLAHLEGGFS